MFTYLSGMLAPPILVYIGQNTPLFPGDSVHHSDSRSVADHMTQQWPLSTDLKKKKKRKTTLIENKFLVCF